MVASPAYPVFTISNGKVEKGARISTFRFRRHRHQIPALVIGERGHSKDQGVVPVSLNNTYQLEREWQKGKPLIINFGEIGQTLNGKPRLLIRFKSTESNQPQPAIMVFLTQLGLNGTCWQTGDRTGCLVHRPAMDLPAWALTILSRRQKVFSFGEAEAWFEDHAPDTGFWNMKDVFCPQYYDFPGQVLVRGTITDTRKYSRAEGEQLIALVPPNVWFRTTYPGSEPAAHYYLWDGNQIRAYTWKERLAAGLVGQADQA